MPGIVVVEISSTNSTASDRISYLESPGIAVGTILQRCMPMAIVAKVRNESNLDATRSWECPTLITSAALVAGRQTEKRKLVTMSVSS